MSTPYASISGGSVQEKKEPVNLVELFKVLNYIRKKFYVYVGVVNRQNKVIVIDKSTPLQTMDSLLNEQHEVTIQLFGYRTACVAIMRFFPGCQDFLNTVNTHIVLKNDPNKPASVIPTIVESIGKFKNKLDNILEDSDTFYTKAYFSDDTPNFDSLVVNGLASKNSDVNEFLMFTAHSEIEVMCKHYGLKTHQHVWDANRFSEETASLFITTKTDENYGKIENIVMNLDAVKNGTLNARSSSNSSIAGKNFGWKFKDTKKHLTIDVANQSSDPYFQFYLFWRELKKEYLKEVM